MTRTVHQLKVTLREVKPPVWRRIVVESDLTLGELYPVLLSAMGWMGGHLHLFDVGGTRYGIPDPEWGITELDENRFRLDDVLPKVGMKMRWDYDFGDGWEHDVVVEAITMPQRGVEYPLCLAGRRACPPEDCGGPWGTTTCCMRWPIRTIRSTRNSASGHRSISTLPSSTPRRRTEEMRSPFSLEW